MYATRIISAPVEFPVSLPEVKAYLQIDTTADDVLLMGLIAAAVDRCQTLTRRQFCQAVRQLRLPYWPGRAIWLPWPNLLQVAGFSYYDPSGENLTIDPSMFATEDTGDGGVIMRAADSSWPELSRDVPFPIRIEYLCGYGTALDVPAAVKQALLFAVGHFYDHRSELMVGRDAPSMVPGTTIDLLAGYTVGDDFEFRGVT